MAKIDLTGQRFGRLKVLHETEKRGKDKNRYWRCLCDCGEYISVNQNFLRRGMTKSCGCLVKDAMSEIGKKSRKNPIDITGERFGKLIAIKRSRKTDDGTKWLWLCQCDCGNEREVTTGELRNMMVTSCGCSSRDRHGTNEEVLNTLISIYKEYGKLSRSELVKNLNENIHYLHHRFKTSSVTGLWELVEKRIEISEKYPRIKNLLGLRFSKLFVTDLHRIIDGRAEWNCLCNCGKEKVVKSVYLTTKQVQSCGCIKKKKDKRNLRERYDKKRVDGVAMHLFKNDQPRKDSSTGYKGVSRYYTRKSKEERYRAWITVKGKKYYKSGFLTPEEAYHNGRLELEKKHLPRKDEK